VVHGREAQVFVREFTQMLQRLVDRNRAVAYRFQQLFQLRLVDLFNS
jgi:hypothetical protein